MNISSIVEVKPNPNVPAILPGDTVRVSAKIKEGDKERTQVFQGVVIRVRRSGAGASFTVRRVAYGVGVERTFPRYSPILEKVEVVRHGRVRRARLYYLRGLSGRASRIKEKRVERGAVELPEELPVEPPVELPAEPPVAPSAEQPVALSDQQVPPSTEAEPKKE